jgi:hypothetical protein
MSLLLFLLALLPSKQREKILFPQLNAKMSQGQKEEEE